MRTMGRVEGADPHAHALVSTAARTVERRLPSVTADIQALIEESIARLRRVDFSDFHRASIAENIATAVHILAGAGEETPSTTAPVAAIDFARRLAQHDVPVTELIRAYRVGQTRFIRHCIQELLGQSAAGHDEGLAILEIVETTSEYVDHVVEQVESAYAQAHESWVRDRSVVLAIQVRELLRGIPRDLAAVERTLDYRMDRDHVGLVLWTDKRGESDPLGRIRRLVGALVHLIAVSTPLVVPADESTAWAWLPSSASLVRSEALATAMRNDPSVSIAIGQPGSRIEGFRRTHQQAVSARSVALAAGEQHAALTPFADVAPIAMLCADLDSARVWVHETLGDLAVDSARNEVLRETARVFLQTGGSYAATAEQLFLHRNSTQYRIRKAEAIRGRPLRDGRLDVELALLACQWMKGAVLWPSDERNDTSRHTVGVARS